jgi:hypothetical protein
MTDDEFRDKFHTLWKEYDSERKKDFLLSIVTFDENNEPDDIYVIGFGCPACIISALDEQVEDGTLTHSQKDHKVH